MGTGQQWWFILSVFVVWFFLLVFAVLFGLLVGGAFDEERQARNREIHEEYERRFGK